MAIWTEYTLPQYAKPADFENPPDQTDLPTGVEPEEVNVIYPSGIKALLEKMNSK